MPVAPVRISACALAAAALAVARLWIAVAPGSAVRWASSFNSAAGAGSRAGDGPIVDTWCRVVASVGARVFRATCLEQSLALVMLLSLARIPSHLVVGVSRRDSFGAHAWVESRGTVIFGGSQRDGFVPILPAPPASTCPE